jgi:type III secretory pathway component EscV
MEITKNFKVRYLIDTLLGIWLLTWLWFLIFNWDIFVVKLNINLGIGVVKMFPFVVFMILGMLIMLAIRYILQYSRMLRRIEVKEKKYQDCHAGKGY